MEARGVERRAKRKTRVQPSHQNRRAKSRRRPPGERYTRTAYTHAISQACRRAGLEHWHPNQLRHSFATRAREVGGLEAAQTALGHSQANVTEIYAERDLSLARQVAAVIG
jgi:integrase